MNRIDRVFQSLRAEGRKALMPFLTAGDPDLDTTVALIECLVANGAGLIEIGIPYSDPVADGPIISASYTRALREGVRFSAILQAIKSLRSRGKSGRGGDAALDAVPFVAMCSYAIIHRVGPDVALGGFADAGFDGVIVPDLPVEEAEAAATKAAKLGLKFIQLVTPTTPTERALRIVESTTGFVYYVSVAGITGERKSLPPELAANVATLKARTDLPICIGFGIGTPEHVRALSPVADGLIVGSALVRRIHESREKPRDELVKEIGSYIASLRAAL